MARTVPFFSETPHFAVLQVLDALHPGSNATAAPDASTTGTGSLHSSLRYGGGGAVTSADGIGGWVEGSGGAKELRLLVTAFNPTAKTADAEPVTVQVSFGRPAEWDAAAAGGAGAGRSGGMMQMRSSTCVCNSLKRRCDTACHRHSPQLLLLRM